MSLPVNTTLLERVQKSIQETQDIIPSILDITIVDETLTQYQKIKKSLDTYEVEIKHLIYSKHQDDSQTYRTKKDLYNLLLSIQHLKIELTTLLLKLRKKREELEAGLTINLNIRTQKDETDYIQVEVEE